MRLEVLEQSAKYFRNRAERLRQEAAELDATADGLDEKVAKMRAEGPARDMRPCPQCGHLVDVEDWPAMEANTCEGDDCDAFLYMNTDNELIATDAAGVTF